MFGKIISFLQESRQELSRVNWPSRPETIRLTLVVIILSLLIAAILGAFDFIFAYILKLLSRLY